MAHGWPPLPQRKNSRINKEEMLQNTQEMKLYIREILIIYERQMKINNKPKLTQLISKNSFKKVLVYNALYMLVLYL